MTNRLLTQIEAQNQSHRLYNEYRKKIEAWLTPFIGTKVIKADNTFTKKVSDLKPDEKVKSFRCIFHISKFNIVCEFDYWMHYQESEGGFYAKNTSYVAKISNGVLTEMIEERPFKEDYSLETINKTQKEIRELQDQIRELELKIVPFNRQRY